MMNEVIKIDHRSIGRGYPPYVIAELSANHNGSIRTALEVITSAKLSGADAVKIQTYRPDTITIDCDKPDFKISGGLWDNRTLYDLYEEAHLPWDWHEELFTYAKKSGITMFSSPFDQTAVDFLEDLNTPAYKIASFEIIDLPLIKYAASTKKPMILSTGMANAEEIEEAIDTAYSSGCRELAVLHCVSGYPAPPEDFDLKTIPDMIDRFNCVTGISDHTIDNTVAIAAVALGASIVEKHVTLNRSAGGPDDSFSLLPSELSQLCKGAKDAWASLGEINYENKSSEKHNLVFRRSLYFVKELKRGEAITSAHIRSIRPGYGLPPKYLDELIGSRVSKDVDFGTPVTTNVLENFLL